MKRSLSPEEPECLFKNLPRLPEVVRYYDDFSDSYGELRNLRDNVWAVHFDGGTRTLFFEELDPRLRELVKRWIAFVLAEFSPVTTCKYLNEMRAIPAQVLMR